MNVYFTIKAMHILSSAILFGTGLGIAFFMLRSQFVSNLQQGYFAVRTAVLADWCFTLPAGLLQPASGLWLGWPAFISLVAIFYLMVAKPQ